MKGVPRETAILICKNQSKELSTNNSKTITTFFVSYEDNYNAQEMISPYFGEKVSNDDPKGNKINFPHFLLYEIINEIEKDNIYV